MFREVAGRSFAVKASIVLITIYLIHGIHARAAAGVHNNGLHHKHNIVSSNLGRRLRLVKRASHNIEHSRKTTKTRDLTEGELMRLRNREDQIRGALNATLIPFGMFMLSVSVFGLSMYVKSRIQNKQKKTLKHVLKDMKERHEEAAKQDAMQQYLQTTRKIVVGEDEQVQQYSGYEFPEFPDPKEPTPPENSCSGDLSLSTADYTLYYNKRTDTANSA